MIPSPLCTVLAGCFCAMVFGVSTARAAGGRIVFSGAVTEPTCSTASVQLAAVAPSDSVDELAPRRLTCGQTATDPGRPYSRTVVSLDAAVVADDRLLGYLAGYAEPGSTRETSVKLIVRTYE